MFGISVFLVGIFGLSFALNGINKNSGEVLDNLTWRNISNITDKIDINSSDIKLDGKLYVTGELCSVIGGEKKCLGSCENNFHWDNSSFSCKPNNCTAQEFISNTYKYNVPELNNGATSAVLTSTNYQDIANGKKYYTRGFACINGVIEVSGSEGSSLNCDIGYEVSGDSCVKSFNCGVEKYNGRTTKLYNGICYYHTSGRYLALPMNRDTKPEGNFVIGDFLFLSDNVVYIDSRTSTYSGTPFGYTPVNKLPIYRRKGGGNPLIRCYLRKEYQKIPGQ